MSDLLSILTQSASSLSAQQAVAATASHNIQNAGVAGYSRQTATLETTLPADQVGGAYIGRGAQLQTVTQARDRFLEAQIPAQLGLAAQSGATSTALASVSVLDPGRLERPGERPRRLLLGAAGHVAEPLRLRPPRRGRLRRQVAGRVLPVDPRQPGVHPLPAPTPP